MDINDITSTLCAGNCVQTTYWCIIFYSIASTIRSSTVRENVQYVQDNCLVQVKYENMHGTRQSTVWYKTKYSSVRENMRLETWDVFVDIMYGTTGCIRSLNHIVCIYDSDLCLVNIQYNSFPYGLAYLVG